MGNELARKQEGHWWSPRALHQADESIVPSGYHCTDGVSCDAKDPVHAKVWDHMVDHDHSLHVGDTLTAEGYKGTAPVAGLPGIPGGLTIKDVVGAGFKIGDWALAHGGQLVLDGAGFLPGVNVLSEGAQSGYHSAHAMFDAATGNDEGAREESAEAGWHGAATLLNVATLEGGNELKAGHAAEHLGHAKHVVHDVHKVVDVAETAWDLTSTLTRGLGGDNNTLPFMGGMVPWLRSGGGQEKGEK